MSPLKGWARRRPNKKHVPGTFMIPDGKVWCEACKETLPNRAAWDHHKPRCPNRNQQVDFHE